MKTKLLFIFLVVFLKNAHSQYDYFKWAKTLSYATQFNAKLPGSGLAVDQYNRTYYVTQIGMNNRVYFNYGELLSTAANADARTNLVHLDDADGDHLFYITKNNRIGLTEFLYANNAWTYDNSFSVAEPITVGTSIISDNTDQVFYIRSADNMVCNIYKNSNVVGGFGPCNATAPAASSSSNLELNAGRVFYVTAGNRIGCLKWDNVNGWVSQVLPNAPAVNAIAPGSKIHVTGDLTSFSVFYIAPNQRVYQYYCNPSISGVSLLSATAPLAKINTNILDYSSNEVRYVGVDGNVHTLYMNDCGWSYYTVNTTCEIPDASIASGKGSANSNKIFFYSAYNIYQVAEQSTNSGFVYKKQNKLMLNNAPFNPIGMNYIGHMNSDDNGASFYPGPNDHYANDWSNKPFTTQASCLQIFDQHLADIASMGFNSIRFNDFHLYSNTDPSDPNRYTDPNLYIHYSAPAQWSTNYRKQVDAQTTTALLSFYDYVVARCTFYNLKVKFFIGLEGGQANTNCIATYKGFLQQFASHFKNNPTIYSYAILQEADISGRIHPTDASAYRGKGDICYYVGEMYDAIRNSDPNHLVNLSVMSSDCVRNFDPGILKVDFMSFHTYPDVADNTHQNLKREIQWISNTMKSLGKPWIIGETGYAGNNTLPPISKTGSYSDQKNYAQFILDEAFSAGASGVCWWHYKDVFWQGQNADPILTSQYPTITGWDNTSNYFALRAHNGNLKPAAAVFSNYVPQMGCSLLYPPDNYYNTLANPLFSFLGTVKNQAGNPLKDAVVLCFNNGYDKQAKTFTKGDGGFTLHGNFGGIGSVYVSAPGYNTVVLYPPFTNGNVVLTPVVCGQGNARQANVTGIEDVQGLTQNSDFILYPNPGNGVFNLNCKNDSKTNVTINITDLLGHLIMEKHFETFDNERIDLTGIDNGVYFIQISGKGFSEVKKLVKK